MAKYDLNIREGEVKNLVRDEWFSNYDANREIGNIDLSVCVPTEPGQLELFDLDFFLWAEAKKGNKEDIEDSLVQLIITIMKAHTYNDYLPPLYLGAFDAEKIAFIPYDDKLQRQVIFDPVLENDIDWTKITPSDHSTPEFAKVKKKAKNVLSSKIVFDFAQEGKELRQFIKKNFVAAKAGTNKINITLNRMTSIFNRWLVTVKPTIKAPWKELEKGSILPADFFLADVISKNNQSLTESLQVLLRSDAYRIKVKAEVGGLILESLSTKFEFTDKQKAHKTFWNKYVRPPRRKERLAMQERRDLLVEPDRRERKGAYFTPHQWVDLSREYLAAVLGAEWQEKYYIWDCCAGTGNLLFGLTEKERIFASTLDEADVTYMKSQKNLLSAHVFQFDFLNDDLQSDKVPEDLRRILKDPEERKKLVIYINPPYAEVSSVNGGKKGVNQSLIHDKYIKMLGTAGREVYTQFLLRIYFEMRGCKIAEFSKLKTLQGAAFDKYRSYFKAKLCNMFIVPGYTFDNVKGQFPIGFKIWNSEIEEVFQEIQTDVYDTKGDILPSKYIYHVPKNKFISNWVATFKIKTADGVGFLCGTNGNDFQHNNIVYILNKKEQMANPRGVWIKDQNLMASCVYFAVRKVIEADWKNDRDQFLYPREAWKEDKEFQYDCLAYTLFNTNIQSQYGTNHWIPFTEKEISAPMLFQSHFMSDFIAGKCKKGDAQQELEFAKSNSLIPTEPIQFSPEAQAVMDAGRELWRYYMTKKEELNFNVNASYYDIRRYFQGTDDKGRMYPESKDETYMRLWGNIKEALKVLAKKIEPKVYLYGFLLDETTLPEDEPEEVEEAVLPVKAPKQTHKTPRKPTPQTVIHYHIDHVDTFNDNSQNITVKKDDK